MSAPSVIRCWRDALVSSMDRHYVAWLAVAIVFAGVQLGIVYAFG